MVPAADRLEAVFQRVDSYGIGRRPAENKNFFDFRCAYGEQQLADQLRDFLDAMVADNPRFFQLLARNVLPLSPPIGLFGNFVVESVDEHRNAFDIKSAMMPIVDYARIYALKHRIQGNQYARAAEWAA